MIHRTGTSQGYYISMGIRQLRVGYYIISNGMVSCMGKISIFGQQQKQNTNTSKLYFNFNWGSLGCWVPPSSKMLG